MINILSTALAIKNNAQKITEKYSLNKNNNHDAEVLQSLAAESQSILFKFHTIYPFDFFPDEIIIDENKVSIVTRAFFLSYHIRSILISDITDVSVDTGLLFATLSIVDSSNYRFPITEKISFLSKKNALTARKIIQGLIMAKNNNIDLGRFTVSSIRDELCTLGETSCEDLRGS